MHHTHLQRVLYCWALQPLAKPDLHVPQTTAAAAGFWVLNGGISKPARSQGLASLHATDYSGLAPT